ncbi:trehalase-like domain-containing protein [Microbacterium sp. A93]|uniref:trehalase-like domain-containing protein n=1 Tax=Microbacterium sp. A93 TaxID=3450716 RepID=UPI003F42ADC6
MDQRIEDYGVIGNLHTTALVGPDGSVDWLCLPRFDRGACFARLSGDETAGSRQIGPAGAAWCTRRRRRDEALVLETEWDTPDGPARADAMPVRDRAPDVVPMVDGARVPVRMEYRWRVDYGHIVPRPSHHGQLHSTIAGPDAVWLDTLVPVREKHLSTVADFEVTTQTLARADLHRPHQLIRRVRLNRAAEAFEAGEDGIKVVTDRQDA